MRTISELSNLTGRRALLTGGAGHIAQAAAQALLEMGAQVALVDLDESQCVKRAQELSQGQSGRAVGLACNLASEAETRAVIHRGAQVMGGLDIIIHCAAFVGSTKMAGWGVPFEQQSVESWDAALRVNLTAPWTMVQEAKSILSQSGHGSVILIGSTYGLVGPDMSLYEGTTMSNPVGYGASKGGLIQLTRYLATILAPKIRVNALSPGGVWRNQPDVFHERYKKRTPMGRMATEEDFKGAVAYLASDLSGYMTGHNLVVDGGWTAW